MLFDFLKPGVDLFYGIHESRWNPFGLEGDLLLFFRDFKKAVDSKDVERIRQLISDDYQSNSFQYKTKRHLISSFRKSFKSMPSVLAPYLEIEICRVPEVKSDREIFLIIRAVFNVHTLGINVSSQPLGTANRMAIILKRDLDFGLLSIANIEEIA